jgi:thiamine biosynthesis lipoprotein
MRSLASWSDWSCTVRIAVEEESLLGFAIAQTKTLMDEVADAASRFRPDSEVSRCNARAGTVTPVSPLLMELVRTALDAARETGGAADPTVGAHLVASGYDRDIRQVRSRNGLFVVSDDPHVRPLPSWSTVQVDPDLRLVGVPRGLALDLGATAKAWTADRAAALLHRQIGGPVMVEIGGDIAVAGADDDPFPVKVAEREADAGETVELAHGGMTTSSTLVRRWRSDQDEMHHIIDPATGRPSRGLWRTATVWAPSAVAANTASTAALVMSDRAIGWLAAHTPVARLVDLDGYVHRLAGWPVSEAAA